MDQFMKFHFTINQNNKIYELNLDPGSSWEDLEAVLEKFKEQFSALKESALKAEQDKKSQDSTSASVTN